MENNIIIQPHVVEKNDSIIIYGAGKFRETHLTLSKTQALLLYVELHKILNKDER
jgi:imidazoleglycerol phosphate synthase glutamine amidotransferase subunit HisH